MKVVSDFEIVGWKVTAGLFFITTIVLVFSTIRKPEIINEPKGCTEYAETDTIYCTDTVFVPSVEYKVVKEILHDTIFISEEYDGHDNSEIINNSD